MTDNEMKTKAAQTDADLIEAVSVEQLSDLFKAAGYRVTVVEQNGATQLMSASQGVGFAVRFGNAVAGVAGQAAQDTDAASQRHIDYTLSCTLQVHGELPVDLAPSWNRTKRFARLAAHGQFLVLEMDVVVAGGVTERHLRSMIELWDRLVQEFLLHLRNRPVMAAAEQPAAASQAQAQAQPVGVDTEVEAAAEHEKATP